MRNSESTRTPSRQERTQLLGHPAETRWVHVGLLGNSVPHPSHFHFARHPPERSAGDVAYARAHHFVGDAA